MVAQQGIIILPVEHILYITVQQVAAMLVLVMRPVPIIQPVAVIHLLVVTLVHQVLLYIIQLLLVIMLAQLLLMILY